MPPPLYGCRDAEPVEFTGDGGDGGVPAPSYLIEDGCEGRGEGVSLSLVLFCSDGAHRPQTRATGLGGGEGLLGTSADLVALPLRHSGHDVDHHLVGLRHITAHELDSALQEVRDHRHTARQPVELGDQEHRLVALAMGKGAGEFGAVLSSGAFDLGVRGDDHPIGLGRVGEDGPLLGFETETRTALFVRGNAVVRDKLIHG